MSQPYRAWERYPKGHTAVWVLLSCCLLTGSLFFFLLLLWARVTCHTVNWAWNLGWHLRAVRLRRANRQQSGDLGRPYLSACVSNSPTLREHALTEPKGHRSSFPITSTR